MNNSNNNNAKKAINYYRLMVFSVPLFGLFGVLTIVGFVAGIPWLGIGSAVMTGLSVFNQAFGFAMTMKYSEEDEDIVKKSVEITKQDVEELTKEDIISKGVERQIDKTIKREKETVENEVEDELTI